MEGTAYENLLGKVYGVNPESKGIDADMYRQMLEEYQNMITRNRYDSQEERIFEFKRSFQIVRDYVRSAITDGSRKILLYLNESDVICLEEMAFKLNNNFFDRFELHQIIVRSNLIFSCYNSQSSEQERLLSSKLQDSNTAIKYKN